ncbi:ankyrin repeat-containing protein, partial [Aspergillus sclerotialis]
MSCPPREEFQIGWICALPIEAAAAKEMLDENFGLLDEQDATDPNSYTLGRIGKHHVVIACLPGGQYGACAATTVANNMIRSFSKSLRIGLMVGIGGGIPSADHDIRLGDIVISYPAGTCGGVVQYDMGKVGVGGGFCRTGCLNSPPRSLLTAVSNMRAAELADDPRYPQYLQNAIGRTTRTRRNFGRPSCQYDRLFKTQHEHPDSADNCDMCPAEWEEARGEREDIEPQPHYGIIASGNSVIKEGRTREQLRLETKALCFEMEAAGLMMDFPCIVIRGICDYSDSHKNKQWQGYAALAAASYAKELLENVPRGQTSQENLATDVCRSIEDLNEEVKGTNQRLDKAYEQQERQYREQAAVALTDQQRRCHQVFKTLNYEGQKDINPNRVPGTCRWASQNPQYLRWLNSCSNDLLWISADPGCGKSVLARSLIDEDFKASDSTLSIYYFFFKDNEEQNNLAAALCAILHQLFSQQPNLLRHAIPSWEKVGDKLRWEVGELWRIFMAATSDPTSHESICVLDALDECRPKDQKPLIQMLNEFYCQSGVSNQKAWLKFLVTSRPYGEMQDYFRDITTLFPHIHLQGEHENDQIHKEIDLVVKIRVQELAKASNLSTDVQQRLEKQLLQMEHRTYLWLHLAIDDIRATFRDSLRPAEESIELVPPSVNHAYARILDRVPSKYKDVVKRILLIIVGARRPLTIEEMAMALGLATRIQSRSIADSALDPMGLDSKIRGLCGLFVFINNSRIYLIHQTAREFLLGEGITSNLCPQYSFDRTETEDQLSQICVRYLLLDDLEDNKAQGREKPFGILEYSAEHWPDHVRNMSSQVQEEMLDLVYRLYDTATSRFALWYPKFWKSLFPFRNAHKMNALHLAAFNGHTRIARRLIAEDRESIDKIDSSGFSALMWASLNRHYEVAKLLLERGAKVNSEGGQFGNALQAASDGGHDRIVQMLLERGADVNAQGGYYGNALQAASHRGHNKIVQMLLERGADANAQDGEYGNALQYACNGGHDKVVQMLLERGADVNAQGGEYGNALRAASHRGHDKIVQMLLERGADVNAQ